MSYGFLWTHSHLRTPTRSSGYTCFWLAKEISSATAWSAHCLPQQWGAQAAAAHAAKTPSLNSSSSALSPKVAYPSRNETDTLRSLGWETDLKTHRVTLIKRESRASPAPNYSRFSTSSAGAKPPQRSTMMNVPLSLCCAICRKVRAWLIVLSHCYMLGVCPCRSERDARNKQGSSCWRVCAEFMPRRRDVLS